VYPRMNSKGNSCFINFGRHFIHMDLEIRIEFLVLLGSCKAWQNERYGVANVTLSRTPFGGACKAARIVDRI